MDAGPDTVCFRLDAAILRDDLAGFKALLSEYETIEALMADVHDSIKYWEVDDPFIQRGLTAEMFDQSSLNKAIFSQKLAFCEACLPLYFDINRGQPLLAALRTALPLEGERVSDPLSTRFGRIIGQFDTTNGGSSYDEKYELVKLQDALWQKLEEKGPRVEIIQWLL